MADDSREVNTRTETTALQDALAAEHTAVWGYGVVGAALGLSAQQPAVDSQAAHRDVRDRLVALLEQRKTDPVPAKAGYTLPFPVLSAVDAANLAVVLEDGVASAWVHVLGGAADHDVRSLAVDTLSATEVRAVAWRSTAGKTPVTSAFPGLPDK
ncbi:ferritin-like domain-containing protein [Petropleomorpha daqingensis]|uniref:DUF4439 domain-containing protein n=1 Tax=Petropleomorpha daqingensis TaxID=2026353 RepID=A0A853C8B5_9ACTN|nr:ferritin-like domain-containing protein [Petropleomorpha daqingensis]NYJ04240.1 hypothetical protein [Petropleomorpha daqingensis]